MGAVAAKEEPIVGVKKSNSKRGAIKGAIAGLTGGGRKTAAAAAAAKKEVPAKETVSAGGRVLRKRG